MVMVRVGTPWLARSPQLLLVAVPVEVKVPPVTPDEPVQLSLPLKEKVAAEAEPLKLRPGEIVTFPLDTVHPRVPDALPPFLAVRTRVPAAGVTTRARWVVRA